MRLFLIRNSTQWLRCFVALFVFLSLPAKSFVLSDEALKVALILKIAKFTHLPSRDEREFNFCFYRGKGYEELIEQTPEVPKVSGLPVRFVFLQERPKAFLLNQCHLLFITQDNAAEIKQILRRAAFSQMLTVSAFSGFAGLGGMIELDKKESHYAFRIDLAAVRDAQVELSSSLLEISTVINDSN